MRLSDESLARFTRLYKEFYGEELTINEARAMASRVVLLYEHLAQPLPEDMKRLMQRSPDGDHPSSLPSDESKKSSAETHDHVP